MNNEFILNAKGIPGDITIIRSERGYKILTCRYTKTRIQNLRSEIKSEIEITHQFKVRDIGHVGAWLNAMFRHVGVNTPVGIVSQKNQIWLQLNQIQVDWLCGLHSVWPGMKCPDEVRFSNENV